MARHGCFNLEGSGEISFMLVPGWHHRRGFEFRDIACSKARDTSWGIAPGTAKIGARRESAESDLDGCRKGNARH
jgi:hypothetical protein